MDRSEIEHAIESAEVAVASGAGLAGTGFWPAVGVVKANPELVGKYADRIAVIDRKAFEEWALITVPFWLGTVVMTLGTVVGLVLVWLAYSAGATAAGLLLLAGTAVTLVTTHGLAHLVVGRVFGMRFTHWFVSSVTRPQPGVKVDYASYLAAPARSRAWMHAAGAIVTKAIPFLALGPALVIPVPWWATSLLVGVGIAQIVTDVVWSTKASDWKKFRREMRFAA